MTIKEKLEKLANENSNPCVSISLNTHKTHPDNVQDEVMLKNLLKESENQVIAEFDKKAVAPLLEKIAKVSTEIDYNYNLESLHIFLSNETQELIKSTWPVSKNAVHISDTFAVRPLIKEFNRSEEYLILLLSQGGVQLYEALNDEITSEIINDDFPFSKKQHNVIEPERRSDSKLIDNMVREFLNTVDKSLVKIFNETGLYCVVICTEDNYTRLMQVAAKPGIYLGYAPINYNSIATHQIVQQSWKIVQEMQQKGRAEAINEMKEEFARNKVVTDLQEIYQAAIDGRGELLIVNQDYSQAVKMTGDRTFDLVADNTTTKVIDDITSNIAWLVLSKKGRVVFTKLEELEGFGNIVLKTRY